MQDIIVQRVARAIAASVDEEDFDSMPDTSVFRAAYLQEARAAIDALRGVELVMRDDGGHVVHELRGSPTDIWRTMIDAALV